jgi:hypothetical protein
MQWLRRRRYREVVRAQLALFDAEYDELVAAARAALEHYNADSDANRSMELYQRFDDLSEDVEDALETMSFHMARSMEDQPGRDYLSEFERQARAAYGDLLPQLRFAMPDADEQSS